MSSQGQARILLVEDVRLQRALAAAWLTARGHGVEGVASVGEAKQALARERFSLVLVDLHLPDGRGEEVLAQVPRGVPVVAITAAEPDARGLKGQGFAGLIPKPFDPERFAAAVETFLPAGPRPAPQAARPPPVDGLAETFRRNLPSHLETLTMLLAEARARPTDAPARQRVQMLAHRLRGSGPVFGYAALGAVCARMEAALHQAPAEPPAGWWAALEAMLVEAHEAADR